jgi:hypothetical protein
MPSYNERDLSEAQRLVDVFLSGGQQVGDELPNLAVADVQTDASEFVRDLEILNDIGAPIIALRMANSPPIPVALSFLFGAQWPRFAGSDLPPRWWFPEFFYDFYRGRSRDALAGDFATIPVAEARASFQKLASIFLATRIAMVREFGDNVGTATLRMLKRAGSPQRVPTPGCNFMVSTNTSGLRVHWSGAYRISPNYFGAPTTPTFSTLQSGTYVFGVDGGAYGNSVQWDTTSIVALPGTPAVHLNY